MRLLDLLLPVRCVVCGVGGEQLCAGCRESLPRLQPPLCERCGAPTAWPVARCRECSGRRLAFASARAAVAYDERARLLVTAWKERGLRRLAADAADVIAETLSPPGRDRARIRTARPGAGAHAWIPPCGAVGVRARRALGAAGAAAGGENALGSAPARADAARPPAERRRRVRPCRRSTDPGRARRRRVHERRHGRGGRIRVTQGRGEASRGRDVRTGRPLDSAAGRRRRRARCSSRSRAGISR